MTVLPMDQRPAFSWRRALLRPEVMTFLLLVIAAIVGTQLSPFFADLGFVLESSTYTIEFGIVALVLTMIVISGEIDLSVGAMMALSTCLFALTVKAGLPLPAAMVVGAVAGAAMGGFNALLVTWLRLPSIIVTIGTMTLYRGIAQIFAGDRSIGGFPDWFVGIDFAAVGIVPVPVIIFVVLALLLGLLLGRTVFGRQIYQTGTSEMAARHAGIRVDRLKTILFVASGVVSALAGQMMASRLGSVRYDLASGGELQMVLIVMLGGTSIFGGRGTIAGTFLALWLLVIIQTGMTVANIAIEAQLTVLGLLLILSIIASNAITAVRRR
ncbi:rhamnose transport system permease protein [Inquilinus ginsengisoli]|uniref:Autoinducer 2 import system permease protein LsrD n=1 Tax=Inquilinus ginsengisoli TaxID=363840 RepID=A0ABU1JRW3_9PROT|nr:ABC transporter permease [Inquilinus ginsengisoli]MDR6290299.1 rhamnose transport system permease protein [Inquilinus ginsengisoli]